VGGVAKAAKDGSIRPGNLFEIQSVEPAKDEYSE
jgi:hypothetical protein